MDKLHLILIQANTVLWFTLLLLCGVLGFAILVLAETTADLLDIYQSWKNK